MNEAHRKQRLLHLLATDYAGRKVAMARKLGNENKKARITQLAGDTEPFGEGAAENLESGLDLPTGWFNHTWPTPKEAEQYKIPIDQDYPAGIGIFRRRSQWQNKQKNRISTPARSLWRRRFMPARF